MEAELASWFPIAVICRVLAVTQAGYHAWLKRPASPSSVERDVLAELVCRVFAAFKGKYGAPRLFRELCKHHGYTGSFTRVQKLMRALGLKAKAGRKYKATTDSKHSLPLAPNLLAQDFKTTATAPNQNWMSPREFQRAFELTQRAATVKITKATTTITTITNDIIFNRKPRPRGEGMAESMSANQRDRLWSKSAEMSPKQAPRISQQ